MQNLIGGRYRTTERLGAGGMGTVYAATDTVTGARVAVKVVSAEVAENDVLLSRFEREVRAVRTLQTPHVVQTFDAGRDAQSGLPFFVMEVLEGDDVGIVIKRLRPLRPDLALRICAQACAGLEAAHAARIIHRDIKPSNLFLATTPNPGERIVKILDFGIAKLAPEPGESAKPGDVTSLTETGSMLGSPLYMSPEQARGHKNIDARADVWSLGVVLYQALTGRTPHPYTDALGELIVSICTEPAQRVEEFAPWVPRHVADIVHHALEINPAARFQSISELRAALLSCLSGDARIHESMLVTLPESERIALPTATNHDAHGARTMSNQPTAHWTGGTTPAAMQLGPVTATGVNATTVVPQAPHRGLLVAAVLGFAACGGLLSFLLFGKARPAEGTEKAATTAQASPAPVATTAETKSVVAPESVAPSASPAVTAAPSTTTIKKALAAPKTKQTSKPPPPGDIYLGR